MDAASGWIAKAWNATVMTTGQYRHIHGSGQRVMLTTTEHSVDRMLHTQRSNGREPGDLQDLVSSSKVVPLGKPEVVRVVHDLCQKPIGRVIFRRIDGALANASPDAQWEEVSRGLVDEEQRVASSREPISPWEVCLVRVIRIEETAFQEQSPQRRARDLERHRVVDPEWDPVGPRYEPPDSVRARRQPLHRKQQVLGVVGEDSWYRTLWQCVGPLAVVQQLIVLHSLQAVELIRRS